MIAYWRYLGSGLYWITEILLMTNSSSHLEVKLLQTFLPAHLEGCSEVFLVGGLCCGCPGRWCWDNWQDLILWKWVAWLLCRMGFFSLGFFFCPLWLTDRSSQAKAEPRPFMEINITLEPFIKKTYLKDTSSNWIPAVLLTGKARLYPSQMENFRETLLKVLVGCYVSWQVLI